MMESSIGATVVIATRNRDRFVANLIEDLQIQTHSPMEVLVIDQSDVAPELTIEVASNTPGLVRIIRPSFRNISMARNLGWQSARFDVVIYLDDDSRCPPDFVHEHVIGISTDGVSMVAGGSDEAWRPPDIHEEIGTYSRWRASGVGGFGRTESQYVDIVPGCNFSVWRHVVAEAGGFDERFGTQPALYEENDLPLTLRSAGHLILFHPQARSTHLAAPSGGSRTRDVGDYVYVLSHNRSIMIQRHSAWYQRPIALAVSAKYILAYSRHARKFSVILKGLKGLAVGWRSGGLPPLCTKFPE